MAAEKTYENKIKTYLTSKDAWFIKYWGGAKYTKSGIPDILVCLNGFFLAIEVKAPNGKPSYLQLKNIQLIRKANGVGVILYPKDYDLFQELCDCLLQGDKTGAELLQSEIDKHLKLNNEERRILYDKPI